MNTVIYNIKWSKMHARLFLVSCFFDAVVGVRLVYVVAKRKNLRAIECAWLTREWKEKREVDDLDLRSSVKCQQSTNIKQQTTNIKQQNKTTEQQFFQQVFVNTVPPRSIVLFFFLLKWGCWNTHNPTTILCCSCWSYPTGLDQGQRRTSQGRRISKCRSGFEYVDWTSFIG